MEKSRWDFAGKWPFYNSPYRKHKKLAAPILNSVPQFLELAQGM